MNEHDSKVWRTSLIYAAIIICTLIVSYHYHHTILDVEAVKNGLHRPILKYTTETTAESWVK